MLEFYRKLIFHRRLLLVFIAFLYATTVFGCASIIALIINGLGTWLPLREAVAWHIMMGLAAVTASALLWGAWRIFYQRRPSLSELARLVERRHPELRDSLSCAIEVVERPQGPNGPMEWALLRHVEQQCSTIQFHKALMPKRFHPALVLLMVFAAMLFSDYAANSDLALKARYHAMERHGNGDPGLVIQPGDTALPRRGDVHIRAEATRWKPDAVIEIHEDGAAPPGTPYPMFLAATDQAEFTAYSVQNPFHYRISTSSLRSRWYRVDVYDPPEFNTKGVLIEPPAYTGEAPREYSEFLDFSIVEGSTVTFQAEVDDTVLSVLRLDGRNRAFEDAITVSPDHSADYQIILENAEGHRSVTPSRTLKIIPDEPPVVEILDPGEDLFANLEEAVPLEVYAADDYGLSRVEVRVSVSGLRRNPIELLATDTNFTVERNLFSALELSRLAVEPGDVISYFAVARDNRQPEARESRSEVYFIEVTTDIPPQNRPEMDGDGDGQSQEVELRSLIVELKRLIRLTHGVLPLSGEQRALHLQELAAALSTLGVESQRVLTQTAFVLMQVEGGEFFRLFSQAVERIREAELLVGQNEAAEAIPLEEEALSLLLKVESYLRSAFPPEAGASGDGPPTAGETSGGEDGDGEEGKDAAQGLDLAALQRLLENLNRSIDAQSAMNTRFERAQRTQPGTGVLNELADMQQDIRSGIAALENDARTLPDSLPLRSELRQAQQTMAQGERASRTGDSERAADSGIRARENLLNASGLLDDAMRQAAARMIGRLGASAEDLARAQSEAAAASRAVDQGDKPADTLPGLRGEQESLSGAFEELLRAMEQDAKTLSGGFPEAAEALAQAGREAAAGPTAAHMTRAANALLYERPAQAARFQDTAVEGLESLAAGLSEAAGTIPAMTASELRNLAERVARERRRLGSDGESADSQPIQRLGADLSRAGDALGNRELTALGEHLQATADGTEGASAPTPATASKRLQQAARILHQYLRAEWLEQRLRSQRQSGPPPEKYRRLVEEYFRALAEEP